MKEKKSTNEYILYEMESKCEAQDYITKKNGILLDTKEDNPYKYYVVAYSVKTTESPHYLSQITNISLLGQILEFIK